MGLKLYNTLTRKKEIFEPLLKGKVGMYSCGPTVYNYAHIGNLRTYIFNDLLKKSLKFLGYQVTHVMNITDVDDKTIMASQKNEISLKEFTRKYEKIFFEDLNSLNIANPDYVLRATENINEMIKLIEVLLKKGYAYKTNDGIYFSISKSKGYGKLAGLEKQKIFKQRIINDEYDKQSKSDFALWKFYTKEDGDNFWESPFGKGRPGWHIECSAMSMKILGKTIDIHTGGSDLIFPHHTNEIAQSEAVTGKTFVRYWLHGGFLVMSEGKMSKSLGNILTLRNLIENNYKPLVYRYLVLTTHYREQLFFSMKNLDSAKNSYERLKNICGELKNDGKINKNYLDNFKHAIEDDLNIPKALQVLWNLLRDKKADGKYNSVDKMDEVLSLNLIDKEKILIPNNIKILIEEREIARKQKDFKKADELRVKINSLGYQIDDTPKGIKIKKID
ncbi:MAG: cysteine--tRNA ligase [Candidatus Pacearchaeota archaeon]